MRSTASVIGNDSESGFRMTLIDGGADRECEQALTACKVEPRRATEAAEDDCCEDDRRREQQFGRGVVQKVSTREANTEEN